MYILLEFANSFMFNVKLQGSRLLTDENNQNTFQGMLWSGTHVKRKWYVSWNIISYYRKFHVSLLVLFPQIILWGINRSVSFTAVGCSLVNPVAGSSQQPSWPTSSDISYVEGIGAGIVHSEKWLEYGLDYRNSTPDRKKDVSFSHRNQQAVGFTQSSI